MSSSSNRVGIIGFVSDYSAEEYRTLNSVILPEDCKNNQDLHHHLVSVLTSRVKMYQSLNSRGIDCGAYIRRDPIKKYFLIDTFFCANEICKNQLEGLIKDPKKIFLYAAYKMDIKWRNENFSENLSVFDIAINRIISISKNDQYTNEKNLHFIKDTSILDIRSKANERSYFLQDSIEDQLLLGASNQLLLNPGKNIDHDVKDSLFQSREDIVRNTKNITHYQPPEQQDTVLWAPIIYGRTLTQDYRILAIPHDLTAQEEKIRMWLMASCRYPEKIRDTERWLIVKNESFCMIGVACMADQVTKMKTTDTNNRRTHVFLGYISRKEKLRLPKRDLDNFKKLYNIVEERWKNKGQFDQLLSDYKCENLDYIEELGSTQIKEEINLSKKEVWVWKDSKENRDILWESSFLSPFPTSLCLGLALAKDIRNGAFMNVTLVDGYTSEIPQKIEIAVPEESEESNKMIPLNVSERGSLAPSSQKNSESIITLFKRMFSEFREENNVETNDH